MKDLRNYCMVYQLNLDKINLYNNNHKNSVSIDNNNLFRSGI